MPETKSGLLIVDDEPLIRFSLSQLFTENGYGVRSAADGLSALDEIHREAPEVLLSDLDMPGMSGFELLLVVRNRFPQIHLIAMSGAFFGDKVPSGVATDAFYQKGRGFGPLLEIMQSLPRHERMAHQLQTAPPPVWVSKYLHNSVGEGYVIIECPECLGTLPKILNSTVNRASETNCAHCRSLVRDAVVPPDDQMSLQRFLLPLQRRHSIPAPAFQSMQELV
jgi:CheY-like chemotaxis protein